MKPPLFWRVVNGVRAWLEARGDVDGTYMQQIAVLKPERPTHPPIAKPRAVKFLNLRVIRSAERRVA